MLIHFSPTGKNANINTWNRQKEDTDRNEKDIGWESVTWKISSFHLVFFSIKFEACCTQKVYHLESKPIRFPVTPLNYCWYFFLLQAKPVPGVKIFRFESTIFYANAEYFRSTLIELTGVDPQNPHHHCSIGSGSSVHYRCSPASPSIEITRPIFPGSTVVAHTAWENGVL